MEYHNPVLLNECIQGLAIKPRGIEIIDAAKVPKNAIAKVCKIPMRMELKFHERKSFQFTIE